MRKCIGGLLMMAIAMCWWSAPTWAHDQHQHEPQAQATQAPAKPEDAVLKVLAQYRAAMEARSVEKLARVMDPDVLVLEGIHMNVGWADYRDNHIGPEMKEWMAFRVADPKVIETLVAGDLAYAVQKATLTIVLADKTVTVDAAETFLLRKGPGGWKIKHIHFSGKSRPA